MPERILVVDDERNLRLTLREILSDQGFEVTEAGDGKTAVEALARCVPDLVLCDWKMPDADGEFLLRSLRDLETSQWLPIIVMTAHGTGQNAMTAIQLGAYDFITKPLDMDELLATIKRALHHLKLQREVDELRAERSGRLVTEDRGFETMVGTSRPMLDLFKAIGRVATTDTSVLILGESGSGKELVASTIHRQSRRSTKPFVVVNCAALPAELLESEFFGHEKGAFTGAHIRRAGKFESASGGTVFLDEIGELPLTLQPKLLRVLQEHSFERLGSSETIAADFRLVAATNRSLQEEVEEKRFRADLFYRLQVFTITNESGGNKADAARRLGIQRRLLYEKMRALGIESSELPELLSEDRSTK